MLVKLLFSLSSISPPETKKRTEQIVTCGAIPALVKLLKFQTTSNIGELATAAILTLSAAPINKPAIAASEAREGPRGKGWGVTGKRAQ
ncbi:hypothetical protein L2E82_46569 [Cichorium intybus]|uniref:Uncharacterized protein n=1 Tax=Cichorium intybus TaxID=13427 RepID=A0ACB8YUF5_CICIN|nr:hypothetical protein L2E82_46569 [Cichorium intybus]